MTAAGSGEPTGRPPRGPSGSGDDRAEQVLSQALRVMAGGGKRVDPGGAGSATGPWWDRVTTTYLMLLAVLVGLVAGGLAGFASLLW